MHKILLYLGTRQVLLTLLLFIIFFSLSSEVLAKPNPFKGCDKEILNPIAALNTDDPDKCPNKSVCYIPIIKAPNPKLSYNCYNGGVVPTTEVKDKLLEDASFGARTGPTTPTSGSGQRCYLDANNGNGTPIPVGTEPADGAKTGIYTAIGCVPTEPQALVEGLLKVGTIAAGAIAFILMLLAALGLITAEGNPEAIKHSQEQFYSAIIGLLIIIFSVLLMQVIGVDILGLPGFNR